MLQAKCLAAINGDDFIHAVTKDKTAVKDRHTGLLQWQVFTIQVYGRGGHEYLEM
jgi:hypothetical protein